MNEKLQFKIRSQYGLILKEMENNPGRWFTVGHFCGRFDHCYVGYKASARLCELQKQGLVISRWSDKTTALGGKLKEYRLSPNYQVRYIGDKLMVKKNEGPTPVQSNFL